MPDNGFASVIPAQVSFLAIYNPLLGPTDETINDQIVFYTSRSRQRQRTKTSAVDNGEDTDGKNEANERLRQIGLAQGMVSFARNFSEGQAVEYVETEKAWIILHELENSWWILASIDLTRLPTESVNGKSEPSSPSYQYSSREMCPPQLLIQQLRRAHSTFLLHQDNTLDALFQRVGRPTFCHLLGRFWEKYVWSWDILLSGNPAVEMFNGIKLSAGGELGIGVGEEEWGSGEREVLEDFVSRTDGLVDLVVSRFGDGISQAEETAQPGQLKSISATDSVDIEHWLGQGNYPRPSDGVIFTGVGAISRFSLLQVSQWMERIYRYGNDAYGLGEHQASPNIKKGRKRRGRNHFRDTSMPSEQIGRAASSVSKLKSPDRRFSPGIPRPLVLPHMRSQSLAGSGKNSPSGSESTSAGSPRASDWSAFGTETFMKYLTLGYGSSWGFSSENQTALPQVAGPKQQGDNTETVSVSPSDEEGRVPEHVPVKVDKGRFIVGLTDEIKSEMEVLDNEESPNHNITSRTLYLKLSPGEDLTKLQVLVYVHQPFIFTFLFEEGTQALSTPSLYRAIHHQLYPLRKSLLTSTSPANAFRRISISNTLDPQQRFSQAKTKDEPVYDLVYDPSNLTIRSSIPNIPDLGSSIHASGLASIDQPPLTRIESLNIHHRLLSTYTETRTRPLELEQTCKTSRGWWIVWMRLNDQNKQDHEPSSSSSSAQEAFLVRKASDYATATGHGRGGSSSARFFRDLGGASASSAALQQARAEMGASSRLAEGLGLDPRKYIENLLNLNR
ncbi:hypothetical protein ASPZODRAFT_63308 [Penicilliopsis zonata CBS 506.65]|uniref:CCZ1/INTU/HSP4 first Longin domain-containing protein n=1 Tax=Penicilliopsis zonata CBS 506.65 TaxID=1073090 RepID=A0A1L9SJV3_9EURO|nr:hypothetical protein ASPZODRAFT_63308 [Penicilliopsis zonata CBS 506.65]OJJ47478.1 hypothetical protein ASPZODRAFT_63308 [Penicilliopsis zonata CBS 506.65]